MKVKTGAPESEADHELTEAAKSYIALCDKHGVVGVVLSSDAPGVQSIFTGGGRKGPMDAKIVYSLLKEAVQVLEELRQ